MGLRRARKGAPLLFGWIIHGRKLAINNRTPVFDNLETNNRASINPVQEGAFDRQRCRLLSNTSKCL